jgi:glycosyltransferase involved in cell wall biosynthesis
MKVALLVPGFSAHERDWCIPALLDYVRVLAQRATVHVFTLRWPEQGRKYSVYGATVHALDGRKQLGVSVLGLWARALRAIASEQRRAPFDVLHAFWADEPGWVAALASRWLNIPAIISLAGGELVGLPDIGYGLQRLPGRTTLIRLALRRATRVTIGSEYLCALAHSQCNPRKLLRVPLGVDTARFSPLPVGGESSIAKRSGEGKRVRERSPGILSVASLHPVKNHALLLRAFRRVAAELAEVQLQLAGDGPLKYELVQLAEGLNVQFLGEVDHGALPEIYRRADVFVQTSRHEAQGMAVLEAAACGVPVVGTPVGVLPEIGLVVRDEREIADQLLALLRDAPRRRALGEAARKKVEAEYSLTSTVERFEQLYRVASRGGEK